MVARMLNGKKGAAYGGWISKPGFDVLTTSPGNFLLDTDSQIFQTILKGTSVITNEGTAVIPAGTVRTLSVALPAAFAGFSNIIMQATYYMIDNSGNYYDEGRISNTFIKYNASGGNVNLSVQFRANGGTGSPSLNFNHWAAWSVYRAQF